MTVKVGDRVYLRVDRRPTGTIVAEPHRHLGYLCVIVRLDGSGLRVLLRSRDVRAVDDNSTPSGGGAHSWTRGSQRRRVTGTAHRLARPARVHRALPLRSGLSIGPAGR